jgi:hypothetical protein
MSFDDSSLARMREIVNAAVTDEFDPGDRAVLESICASVEGAGFSPILEEFFDFEPLTLAVYEQFRARGTDWPQTVRAKLAEALFFCGRDEEADSVLGGLA